MTRKGLFFAFLLFLLPMLGACGEEPAQGPAAVEKSASGNATQAEKSAAPNAGDQKPQDAGAAKAPGMGESGPEGKDAEGKDSGQGGGPAPSPGASKDAPPKGESPGDEAGGGEAGLFGADGAPLTGDAAARLEADRWNSYVLLANEADPTVLATLEDYMTNFPEREYRAPDKDFSYRRPATGGALPRGLAGIINEAMANAAREPQKELDRIALAYGEALHKLWQALNAAASYYTDESHKADNAAKGKELHEAVVQAAQAYMPLSESFDRAMRQRDEDMLEESVEGLRQSGMNLHAAILDLLVKARAVDRELGRQASKDSAPPLFDDPAWNRVAKKFADACADLKKSLTDTARLQAEDLSEESAAEFISSAKALCEYAASVPQAAKKRADAKTPDATRADLSESFWELMNDYINIINSRLQ